MERSCSPLPAPWFFGSASMSANVFCFDQPNCTGTSADGNRKQIEPGWKCLKGNTAHRSQDAQPGVSRAACSTISPRGLECQMELANASPFTPAPTKVQVGRLVVNFVTFGLPGPFFSITYTLKMWLTQSCPGDADLQNLCSAPQGMRGAVGIWRTRQGSV